VNLSAVKAASRPELAACAIAAAKNSAGLLRDAELLAGAGRNGRAYSLAALAVEESGKALELATLAVIRESVRARVPLRRLLEWHQLKLAGGLLLAVLPFGSIASRLAQVPAAELAERVDALLAPADEADRLKRRGLYVDLEASGIREPSEITSSEVASQLRWARQAAASVGVLSGPKFPAWLANPPADGLDLAEKAVCALAEAEYARTPQAAFDVIMKALARFRDRSAGQPNHS